MLPWQMDAKGSRHLWLLVALGLPLLAAPAAASPSLRTFLVTAGGRAAQTFNPPCTGGGSPAPVYDFFGVWGVGIPTAGLDSCNIAGGISDLTSPTAPLSDSRSLVSSWPEIPTNWFSGSTRVLSNYGTVSAHAHAEFSGESSNLNSTGCDAFGTADEGFTITSPSFASGQPGTVVFHITVTGAFSTTSLCRVGVELSNRVNNAGNPYALFACHGNYASQLPNIYSWAGDGLGGFTLSPGAMSGSGTVSSAQIPIVFGTALDYKFGMLVDAVPDFSSTVDSHFRAAITRIEVKGPAGEAVTNFVVVSASGTPYDMGGVTAVDGFRPNSSGNATRLEAIPNPARARVELRFALPALVASRLDIYDPSGRRVRVLDDAQIRAGGGSAWWDGRDAALNPLPNGVYYARLSWLDRSTTIRFALIR